MQISWPVSIWYEFLLKGISEQTIEKNNVLEFVVKFFLTKMKPFPVFFMDFDHKLQHPFLNKSEGLFFIQSAFQGLRLLPIQFVIH